MNRSLRVHVRALFALGLLITLLSTSTVLAQVPYHGFQRFDPGSDTTFPIGVHGAKARIGLLKGALHIDYIQLYGEECNLSHLDSATWHGLSFEDSVTHAQDRDFYRAAYDTGMKVVTSPCSVAELFDDCVALENYYGWNADTVDAVGFTDPGYIPPGGIWRNDSLFFATMARYDTLPNRRFFGATFLTQYLHGDTLMAGGSKHTYTGLHTARNWYSRFGKPDSSSYFDVALTLKANGDSLNRPIPPIADTAVIAYALLYRRDTSGQWRNDTISDCGCNFYYPMRKYAITKSLYLNNDSSRLDPNTGYKEFTYTLQFLDSIYGTGYPVTVQRWHSSIVDTIYRPGGPGSHRYNPVGRSPLPSGAGNDTAQRCGSYCTRLLAALKAQGMLPPTAFNREDAVEGSDFYVDIYTTRVVPVTFLKAIVSNHVTSSVKNNVLDGVIQAAIDSIHADTMRAGRTMALEPMLWRYGIRDEPYLERFLSYRLLSSKVQRAVLARDTNDRRGIWCNPIGESSSLRAYSGDLDSTDIKMVQMVADQQYNISGALPIRYANIDSMSAVANGSFYRLTTQDAVIGSDTVRYRFTMGNSAPDYNYYTLRNQGALSIKVAQITEAVDVARNRFSRLGAAPYPVYYVSQVQGKLADTTHFESDWRPTTPEEITVQPWLALTCGVDGLVFSDFQYYYPELGVMHGSSDSATMSRYTNREYDSLLSGDPRDAGKPGLPRMWLGFGTRLAAVKSITDALHDRILPVYRFLGRSPARISMHDTTQTLAAMPLVDSLFAEQARRYTTPFTDSTAFDARSRTYMDLAVFQPGRYLPSDTASGARYLIVVNRRCWPIDTAVYSDSSTQVLDRFARWDTLAGIHHGTHGLGNIDVRRPVIVLKQSTEVIADSFRVAKVGDSSWNAVVAPGERLNLDWLKPGSGEMYRITPVRHGVSPFGTTWNNAVRSVALTDSARGSQMIVYERDSIVYAMTMDSAGRWLREFRISDSIDATPAGRTAYDMFPTIAPVRNGTAWLCAWERYDISTGKTTVEARYWPSFPHPDSMSLSLRVLALAAARSITGGYHMAPAVTGTDSGFVVAWASPDTGITAVAIPNHAAFKSADISSGFTSLGRVTFLAITYNDSLCQYPTLAYVPNYNGIGQIVHLAWQQNYSAGKEIFYRQLLARFPATGKATLSAATNIEDVNVGMGGCQFVNPCIAADSVRVGVAFQSIWPTYRGKGTPSGGVSVITLRFRDSTSLKGGWHTAAYYWGDDTSWYERPTMTEFPVAPRSALTGAGGKPEGALSWFRVKGDSSAAGTNQIYFYRFGKNSVNRVREGGHPSLTQVPFRSTAPYMAQSSLLYRGAYAASFLARTAYSTASDAYIDGILMNHPSNPDTNFTAIAGGSIRLFTGKTLRTVMTGRYPATGPCDRPSFSGGIGFAAMGLPGVLYPSPDVTVGPDLPPSYFTPPEGTTFTETLEDASGISRTSSFPAGPSPVTIRRLVIGSNQLVNWLNTEPYDSIAGEPANLRTHLELLRGSDSAVLWRGDTVEARAVADSTYDDLVSVPVQIAPPGTSVFIRLMMTPNNGLADTAYDVSAGFYNETDSTEPGFLKLVGFDGSRGVAGERGALSMMIVPNPTRSTAEVRVTTTEAGVLEVGIYEMLGGLVKSLPPVSIAHPGAYAARVDAGALAGGSYTIHARMNGHGVSGRLVVVR